MISYEDSGVSIEKSDKLTKIILDSVKNDNIGNFAGIYEHPYFPEYYLVACTDGVGTKIIPLLERKRFDTIAIDLIAMNLNDLITTGAKPMFFLDYLATNSLDIEDAGSFVVALKEELEKYHCTLLGGETAELGSLIKEKHFDVGGFMVGVVKKPKLLTPMNVNEDDIVIGLASSGGHSNGFSLIRKLHDEKLLSDELFEKSLAPTHIYANVVEKMSAKKLINATAHITGGGIVDNLRRSVPKGFYANIKLENIPQDNLFKELERLVGFKEAYHTFNMGVGFCIIAGEENCDEILEIAAEFSPFIMGKIKRALTNEEKNTRVCLR